VELVLTLMSTDSCFAFSARRAQATAAVKNDSRFRRSVIVNGHVVLLPRHQLGVGHHEWPYVMTTCAREITI